MSQPASRATTRTSVSLRGAWPWFLIGWTLVAAAVAFGLLESFDLLVVCGSVLVWCVVPVSLLMVLAGLVGGKRHLWVIGGLTTLVAVSGPVAGWFVGKGVYRVQVRKSCERGNALATALERHRSTHGSYPAQLEELVPSFLPSIPVTCIGFWSAAPFHYECLNRDYELTFDGSGFDLWIRRSDGTWSCD